MAKKQTKDDSLSAGLILQIDQDELGLPRVRLETEPHDSETDKAAAFAVLAEVVEARKRAVAALQPVALPAPGKPLQEAIDEFLADGVTKSKTFGAYRTALKNMALPFFGSDVTIADIDQERFAQYVKHVFADEGRAYNTKVGYINAFTSMFGWLRSRHPKQTAILSTKKLFPANKTGADEQRGAFTLTQLEVIFRNARKYLAGEPHKFWVTVACAFTGCRVEEIAQVNLATDLRQIPGSDIWYFDFNEKPDSDGVVRKSLKRAPSKRVVPIHSALVKHGFLAYLEDQKQLGKSRPFESGWPPLTNRAKGGVRWAHYISRWGGGELTKLNAAGTLNRTGLNLAYFHSMRHTFAHELATRGVTVEQRAALQGQTVAGGGENANRYTKLRQDPKVLSRLVEEHLVDYADLLEGVLAP